MVNLSIKIHFEKNTNMCDWASVFQYPAVSYLVYSNDVMQRGFNNVCSGSLCFNTRIPRFTQRTLPPLTSTLLVFPLPHLFFGSIKDPDISMLSENCLLCAKSYPFHLIDSIMDV